jgi:hypothetical protein
MPTMIFVAIRIIFLIFCLSESCYKGKRFWAFRSIEMNVEEIFMMVISSGNYIELFKPSWAAAKNATIEPLKWYKFKLETYSVYIVYIVAWGSQLRAWNPELRLYFVLSKQNSIAKFIYLWKNTKQTWLYILRVSCLSLQTILDQLLTIN